MLPSGVIFSRTDPGLCNLRSGVVSVQQFLHAFRLMKTSKKHTEIKMRKVAHGSSLSFPTGAVVVDGASPGAVVIGSVPSPDQSSSILKLLRTAFSFVYIDGLKTSSNFLWSWQALPMEGQDLPLFLW